MSATPKSSATPSARVHVHSIKQRSTETVRAIEEWALPDELASCGKARQLVTTALLNWQVPGDDAVLVVSELVGNALVHGEGPVVLRLAHDGPLVRIEVRDTSSVLPYRHSVRENEVAGRGLLIVGELAADWGVVIGPGRCKTVWAELPV
ncbi:ATP-binding protein [Streptomyces sp. NBC_00237]|uniref:ATP-binding protein n=1 Tax=Streptomyces sp. NBC_00237 TaxID=2975687 RepID=UPI00225BFF35|nr:ATP-binding protein [Streptomyces sp. NBC_00237]MCX5206883.1 ATP-binding protein [Streptomyces sp. NBC_00237]